MARAMALALLTLGTAYARGSGEIVDADVGDVSKAGSRHAYFIMVGPMDVARTYRPWLYSTLAAVNALRGASSTADVVLILARRRDGFRRHSADHEGVKLAPVEEAELLASRARWRYAAPPGKVGGHAGFHLGHYKLLVWQHTEYHTIQLLDADLLPLVNMDSLFALPRLLHSRTVTCPGKVSPLNAGWLALEPSTSSYLQMDDLLRKRANALDSAKPWGHVLEEWHDSSGNCRTNGWDFMDGTGNQGELYSFFRFDVQSLAIIFDDPKKGHSLRIFDGGESEASVFADASDQTAAKLLSRAFPCPFPVKKSKAKNAYAHFTGVNKPWLKFQPQRPLERLWYAALTRNGTDMRPLRDLFPGAELPPARR